MSSVPYVPPDTMKNVAATSGQRVNLARFFLVLGRALDGSWAGTDTLANCFSLILLSKIRSRPALGASLYSQNTEFCYRCKKKVRPPPDFCTAQERNRQLVGFVDVSLAREASAGHLVAEGRHIPGRRRRRTSGDNRPGEQVLTRLWDVA